MSDSAIVPAAPPADDADAYSIRVQADVEALAFLPEEDRRTLLAYHQNILADRSYNWHRVKDEIGYDSSTMSRVFRGKYAGSYANVVVAIRRHLENKKDAVSASAFVKNRISKTIWNAFDYALANSTGTLVIGPSRTGKTEAAKAYAASNDARGKVVYFQTPPIGGVGALLSGLCRAVGASRRLIPAEALNAVCRALGPSRLLVIDEAHRLLSASSVNRQLEVIRYIHDETRCAFALIATARLEDELTASRYMHEQLIGRISAPIRVGERISADDWMPIAQQFLPGEIDPATADALRAVVATSGRIAALVHTLQLAQRDANMRSEPVAAAHVARAVAWRKSKFNQKFFDQPKGDR
jgi:DNA transposition AAA+ family ATPase